MTSLNPVQEYTRSIEQNLIEGNATEHTHRPALKSLLESLSDGTVATNEPQRIACGAPDFVVTKGALTVGYVEAKDVGKSLDEAEKSEQLGRYRESLSNLILTDYLEFRWYVDGERRLSARLGTPTKKDGKIKRDNAGAEAVAELLGGFLAHKAEAVGTPKDLALRMARMAHMIRNLIVSAFETETDGGSLHGQLAAFRDNLIPDLSVEYFADMYAQTITYGLFAARCTAPDKKSFTRFDAAQNLPKTNPFLRKLFQYIAGYELDDRIAWLVDDLAQVLAQADMEAVLKDFGKHSGKEDPVVHFYETFLKAYDPKVREMRGVYYTPEPVVSYIVRSIDHILKTRFGKPQGLADDKTLILDPAVGTATFLYMVINEIHNTNISQGQQGMWNDYVAEKLLPRIFGFELLMAPYAVAHLKLGILLQETGYEFKSDQRLGIYLTNTLEGAFKKSELLAGFNKYIVDEANAAAEIKKDKPIMVVLGNPPYSNFGMMNKGEWISDLLNDYKKGLNEKKLNLEDDFIKFIRFGQWRIDQTGSGILAFITNNTYIDGITRRRMRQSLLETFSDIYILDLHGSTTKKGKCPHDSQDDNVFDIQQGVAIGIFVKDFGKQGLGRLHHAELWGTREKKYEQLSETDVSVTKWTELKPKPEYFFFVPKDFANQEEYEQFFSLRKAMKIGTSAVQTKRDALFIDFDRGALYERMKDVLSPDATEWTLNKYPLHESPGWSPECLKHVQFSEHKILEYLHRPFDKRFIYYDDTLLGRSRITVFQHLLKPNLALATLRQTVDDEFRHVFCCRGLCDINLTIGHDVSDQVFPLYLYPTEGEMQFEDSPRQPNLSSQFIKAFSEKVGLTFIEDGKGDLKKTFGPEDIFHYAYAILHSPTYRTRYIEFLKIDFPRLPLASDKKLFEALAEKGAELVDLHLMESPALNKPITKYPVTGSNVVDKVSYDEYTRRVYINKTQHFEGVPSEVWGFHIGGYQVCQKWLKDRKSRKLTVDEAQHYQKVIVALKETMRLMDEIDSLIPSWPLE